MANLLILNQPQVFVGIGTLSFTIPSTGLYNAQFTATVPEALATGSGSGSGQGLGAGTGGGGEGFTGGDLGLGHGGVGQGFGAGNGYQQPPAAGSNQTSGPAISSGLTVVVNQNGSPIYTAPALAPTQGSLKFKFSFSATAADAITVVLSSSVTSDKVLNGLVSTTTIGQGE